MIIFDYSIKKNNLWFKIFGVHDGTNFLTDI